MDPSRTRLVEDAGTLRALAHPLRLRLLGTLRLDGPSTASELGRRLGESSGSTSYHLRQLERYGFVRPAREQRSRRERWWEAAHETTAIRLRDEGDDEALRALDVVVDAQLRALVEGVRRRQQRAASAPREWREAHLSSDLRLTTTPERLAALGERLPALLAEHGSVDEPGARTVVVHVQSYLHEEAVPEDAVHQEPAHQEPAHQEPAPGDLP